ncbi:MAG: pseudouridine synthase [Terriglobales bacterium]
MANPKPVHKPARRKKPEMTLDRALSRYGLASRSAAAVMIRAGRVTVDGRVERNPLAWVAPGRAVLRLDRRRLTAARRVYWAINKPAGCITSHGDPSGRRTIYDLLPPGQRWLFPVGRLDQDTTGLLLLTNDSVFAERITNPGSKVEKAYLVKLNGLATVEAMARLRAGVDIGQGESSSAARVELARENPRVSWLEVTIAEGKNRQVRRMMAAVGYRVLKLTRIRIGRLALGGLAPGAMRAIRPEDVLGRAAAGAES